MEKMKNKLSIFGHFAENETDLKMTRSLNRVFERFLIHRFVVAQFIYTVLRICQGTYTNTYTFFSKNFTS